MLGSLLKLMGRLRRRTLAHWWRIPPTCRVKDQYASFQSDKKRCDIHQSAEYLTHEENWCGMSEEQYEYEPIHEEKCSQAHSLVSKTLGEPAVQESADDDTTICTIR